VYHVLRHPPPHTACITQQRRTHETFNSLHAQNGRQCRQLFPQCRQAGSGDGFMGRIGTAAGISLHRRRSASISFAWPMTAPLSKAFFPGKSITASATRYPAWPRRCPIPAVSCFLPLERAWPIIAGAIAPCSGFHHAGYDFAGGFCTFNGLMVTALSCWPRARFARSAFSTCDQHWGNGTQDIIERLQSG
jgi:hypothetical protein